MFTVSITACNINAGKAVAQIHKRSKNLEELFAEYVSHYGDIKEFDPNAIDCDLLLPPNSLGTFSTDISGVVDGWIFHHPDIHWHIILRIEEVGEHIIICRDRMRYLLSRNRFEKRKHQVQLRANLWCQYGLSEQEFMIETLTNDSLVPSVRKSMNDILDAFPSTFWEMLYGEDYCKSPDIWKMSGQLNVSCIV